MFQFITTSRAVTTKKCWCRTSLNKASLLKKKAMLLHTSSAVLLRKISSSSPCVPVKNFLSLQATFCHQKYSIEVLHDFFLFFFSLLKIKLLVRCINNTSKAKTQKLYVLNSFIKYRELVKERWQKP